MRWGLKKIVLIIMFIITAGLIFAESITTTAEVKFDIRYMLDLRQGGYVGKKEVWAGAKSKYIPVYGTVGDYVGFLEVKTIIDKFELNVSKLIDLQFNLSVRDDYPNTIRISPRVIQPFTSAYLKYDVWDWYFAAGMMNSEVSHARFFTLSDVFFEEKRFDYLCEPRFEWYFFERVDRVNFGYANNLFSLDVKILPDNLNPFGNWKTFGYFCSASLKLNDFKLSIYSLFDRLLIETHLDPDLSNSAGTSVSYKLNDGILLYFEMKASSAAHKPTLVEMVIGTRIFESKVQHIILESFYSIDGILKVFAEGEKKNVFGWEGWDANAIFLYSPSEFNNFKSFFTMRKNWSENWLSEFRYGYESMGNHIIDASIRFYDL